MPGMPSAPAGRGIFDLRQAVSIGGHGAQGLALCGTGCVQINAVEIIARLLG